MKKMLLNEHLSFKNHVLEIVGFKPLNPPPLPPMDPPMYQPAKENIVEISLKTYLPVITFCSLRISLVARCVSTFL